MQHALIDSLKMQAFPQATAAVAQNKVLADLAPFPFVMSVHVAGAVDETPSIYPRPPSQSRLMPYTFPFSVLAGAVRTMAAMIYY